jgi:hypothetical protein
MLSVHPDGTLVGGTKFPIVFSCRLPGSISSEGEKKPFWSTSPSVGNGEPPEACEGVDICPTIAKLAKLPLAGLGRKPTDAGSEELLLKSKSRYCQDSSVSPLESKS